MSNIANKLMKLTEHLDTILQDYNKELESKGMECVDCLSKICDPICDIPDGDEVNY